MADIYMTAVWESKRSSFGDLVVITQSRLAARNHLFTISIVTSFGFDTFHPFLVLLPSMLSSKDCPRSLDYILPARISVGVPQVVHVLSQMSLKQY